MGAPLYVQSVINRNVVTVQNGMMSPKITYTFSTHKCQKHNKQKDWLLKLLYGIILSLHTIKYKQGVHGRTDVAYYKY
jgi:hypothetical protein